MKRVALVSPRLAAIASILRLVTSTSSRRSNAVRSASTGAIVPSGRLGNRSGNWYSRSAPDSPNKRVRRSRSTTAVSLAFAN